MPRTARAIQAGLCYHLINRGNGRAAVFHDDDDYHAFVRLMRQATARVPLRPLAFCLMPNHFHLVAWPSADDQPARWMDWLLTTHVRRYRRRYGSAALGTSIRSIGDIAGSRPRAVTGAATFDRFAVENRASQSNRKRSRTWSGHLFPKSESGDESPHSDILKNASYPTSSLPETNP